MEDYVKKMDQRLLASFKRKALVGCVSLIIPCIAGFVDLVLDSALLENLENVVDFSDDFHVRKKELPKD